MAGSNENISDVFDMSNKLGEMLLNENANSHSLFENNSDEESAENSFNIKDLPCILIVTNIAEIVFDSAHAKEQFESLFRMLDSSCTINYLKNFRRARIEFASIEMTIQARIKLNELPVCGQAIKCYFAQPIQTLGSKNPHLVPPIPPRNFLISPPSSPPVGWESIPENAPIMLEYDLISALANLAPGEEHELHQATHNQPRIVVSVCENPEGFEMRPKRLIQTRRPNGVDK